MGKPENDKGKTTYRWFIPLLATIPFFIWEISAFGFAQINLVKGSMSFIILSLFYTWLMSWIKDRPGEKPPTVELILFIPFFIAFMLLVLPPFPYVRPWFVTIILLILGFEFWVFGIGYWIQETKLKKLCTGRTIAAVLGNAQERMDQRPGEISPITFYPILAYTVNGECLERQFEHGQPHPMEVGRRIEICYNPKNPEEFYFLSQKENKALTFGVPVMLIVGTVAFISSVLSIVLKWSF